MPLIIPEGLSARQLLAGEGIKILPGDSTGEALDVLVLNLMPNKQTTELHLGRMWGQSEIPVRLTFLRTMSYAPRNCSLEYLVENYAVFPNITHSRQFDAFLVTGTPASADFSTISYMGELRSMIDWAMEHTRAKIGLCWGVYAMADYLYGIKNKQITDDNAKLSGVFMQQVTVEGLNSALTKGLPREFAVPVSRYRELAPEEVARSTLTVVAGSPETGAYIMEDPSKGVIFIMNHPEYRNDLDDEYIRDLKKPELKTTLPRNFYVNDDPRQGILPNTWSAHGLPIYQNLIDQLVSPSSPSPEFLRHLMQENQAIIVPIGTSGSGKSEFAKRMASASAQGKTFPSPDSEGNELLFDSTSIDLLVAEKLLPRIKADFPHKLPNGASLSPEPLTAAITDAQELS